MSSEIREIPGFPGYGASSDGRVWSHWKWGTRTLAVGWREITQGHKPGSEYKTVSIGPFGFQKRCQVHRLVIVTFHGPIPEGMVVDHLDCDKSNNSIENLEIVSSSENERRAFVNGRKLRGIEHGMAKYSEAQIQRIKREYVRGEITQKELAKKIGVGAATVCQVLTGRQWTHV